MLEIEQSNRKFKKQVYPSIARKIENMMKTSNSDTKETTLLFIHVGKYITQSGVLVYVFKWQANEVKNPPRKKSKPKAKKL